MKSKLLNKSQRYTVSKHLPIFATHPAWAALVVSLKGSPIQQVLELEMMLDESDELSSS